MKRAAGGWLGAAALVCLALVCLAMALPGHAAPDSAASSQSQSQSLAQLTDPDLQPVNSTKALKTSEQSVVRVLVVYRGYGGVPLDTVGMGSGFVVAPGFIVTNYHVVEVPPEASSADIYIVPHKDSGASYQPVQLVKPWVEGDLALLSAPGLKIAPLKLFLSPYKNERVVSMGYPDVTDHLLNRSGTALLEPADAYVTQGSIALFASTNPDGSRVDTLFHTAPINHGNSGGPLLNECGQVVGVNTWTALSTVSAAGSLDVSAGQYVATHVSALNTFLASAGVTPGVVNTPCYAKSEDEIVKDDALSRVLAAAAEAQIQRLAEQKKAEADRAAMERWQLGAMVVLSVLVLVLIGLIIRREIRHRTEIHSKKEPDAPTAFSVEEPVKPEPKPGKARPVKAEKARSGRLEMPPPVKVPGIRHPIPWGWILLALVIVLAVAGFLLKERDIDRRLSRPKTGAPVATAATVTKMHCTVEAAASPNPLANASVIDFEFDAAHACINGRKPYERQADGSLLSFTNSDTSPVVARLELSADGATFTRYDYRLDPVQHKAFSDQMNALGSFRCSAHADQGALAALEDNLKRVRTLTLSYLTMPPETKTVWRCKAV